MLSYYLRNSDGCASRENIPHSRTESHVTCVTPVHSFWHTTCHVCGFDFFAVGGVLLINFLSLRWGTVLCDECRPGTLCSTALAYFTESPSINWILIDNWSAVFLVLFLHIIITFRNTLFVLYSFAYSPNGCLCFSWFCHLPQNREKHKVIPNLIKACSGSVWSKYILHTTWLATLFLESGLG